MTVIFLCRNFSCNLIVLFPGGVGWGRVDRVRIRSSPKPGIVPTKGAIVREITVGIESRRVGIISSCTISDPKVGRADRNIIIRIGLGFLRKTEHSQKEKKQKKFYKVISSHGVIIGWF